MVTRKQSKEYERLHKVLINTYHEKERGREAIVLLFEGIADFFEVIQAESEIVFQEKNIYNASVNQQEFLGGLISDYKNFTSKANKFGEDNFIVYEEVEKCMEKMIAVCEQLGSNETDKKESEVILLKMGNRIDASKLAMSKSTIELDELISRFNGYKALHNSRKN